MESDSLFTPLRVGIFVIAGIICIVLMLVAVSTMDKNDNVIETYAYFDDVTGLAVKSNVMSSGIPVGEIKKISLEGARARVDFTVSRDIHPRRGEKLPNGIWKNGATVAKQQIGFVGDFYIKVAPGIAGEELENGDEIHNVVEPPSIGKMMEQFDDIAGNINDIVLSIKEVIASDESKEQMKEIISHVAELTHTLNQIAKENGEKFDRIVQNAEFISQDIREMTVDGGRSVRNILRDAEAVVAQVRSMVGDSSGELQSGLGSLKGSLDRLQSTLDSLNYALQNVQDITDKINEGEGTIGELVNNPTIAEKTENILTEADEIISRVGRLRTIVDIRSEYHLGAGRLKNIVGLRLQPSRDKYYMIELIDDYRGVRKDKSEVITTDQTGKDPRYSKTVEVTEDRFKFSVEFAKTFYLNNWIGITGRFGIIEQTGGVGANLLLFDNEELNIQADLFDFSGAKYPRLRTFGSYRFFDLVYILGGVDDVLNADRRQYMMGLGLRFDDEDLKALISLTGVPSSP